MRRISATKANGTRALFVRVVSAEAGPWEYRLRVVVSSTSGRLALAVGMLHSDGFAITEFSATPTESVLANDPNVSGLLSFQVVGPPERAASLRRLGEVLQRARSDGGDDSCWSATSSFAFTAEGPSRADFEYVLSQVSTDGANIVQAEHAQCGAPFCRHDRPNWFKTYYEVACRTHWVALHIWQRLVDYRLRHPAVRLTSERLRGGEPAYLDLGLQVAVAFRCRCDADELWAMANV